MKEQLLDLGCTFDWEREIGKIDFSIKQEGQKFINGL